MLFCFYTCIIFLPGLLLISMASHFTAFFTALPSPPLLFKAASWLSLAVRGHMSLSLMQLSPGLDPKGLSVWAGFAPFPRPGTKTCPRVIYIPTLEYSVAVKKAQNTWCEYTDKDLLLNGKREIQLRMYGMSSFLRQNLLLYCLKFFNKHVLLPLCVCIFKETGISYKHYKDWWNGKYRLKWRDSGREFA